MLVQGPYLLKMVPDRVTDDTGAMLSNFILRMNKYQPQHGRWITRTVLNHMGRECFVIRIRQVSLSTNSRALICLVFHYKVTLFKTLFILQQHGRHMSSSGLNLLSLQRIT